MIHVCCCCCCCFLYELPEVSWFQYRYPVEQFVRERIHTDLSLAVRKGSHRLLYILLLWGFCRLIFTKSLSWRGPTNSILQLLHPCLTTLDSEGQISVYSLPDMRLLYWIPILEPTDFRWVHTKNNNNNNNNIVSLFIWSLERRKVYAWLLLDWL